MSRENDSRSFTGPHRFTMQGWISTAPFERLLHMEILEAAEGRAVLKMPFLLDLAQGAGLMHGGALVSLADTAVAMAIKSLLSEKSHFATISLEIEVSLPGQAGDRLRQGRDSEQEGQGMAGQGGCLR